MPSATASISRQSSKIIICFPKQGKSRSRRPVTRRRASSQRHVSARSRLQKPSPVRASHTNTRPFQFELNQTIVHRRLDAGKHRKLIGTCTCHSIPGEYKSRFADGVAVATTWTTRHGTARWRSDECGTCSLFESQVNPNHSTTHNLWLPLLDNLRNFTTNNQTFLGYWKCC